MWVLSSFSHAQLFAILWTVAPLGSSVPEILQARILEWFAISFSNVWEWKQWGIIFFYQISKKFSSLENQREWEKLIEWREFSKMVEPFIAFSTSLFPSYPEQTPCEI